MLEIQNLKVTAGAFHLDGIDLSVPDSSYLVLLGPPGAGKSVLIETLCGLRRPTSGSIVMDGQDIADLEPRDRRIGYVPQDYAVFPAKRVLDNVIFGLRARGMPRSRACGDAAALIEMMGIGHILDRWPATLSGGEQQRVAMARALALRPRLLLLDEPVSALDEGSRDRICRELRRIQRDLGISTLHISHNLEEAFSVADMAAILNGGRIVQVGTIETLVRRPQTVFVARFLRAENVFDGVSTGSAVEVGHIRLPAVAKPRGAVACMIRPESIRLGATLEELNGSVSIPAVVERKIDRGPYVRVDISSRGIPLVAYASHHDLSHLRVEPGADIWAHIPSDSIHLLQPD